MERSGIPQADDGPDRTRSVASAPLFLFATGRLVERELGLRLADLGLTLRTFGILGHLAGSQAPLSYSELARRSSITVQSMHAAVRGLVASDLVDASGTAGQTAKLTLTDAGRALLERGRAVLAGYEAELAGHAGVEVETLRAAASQHAAAARQVDLARLDPG